MKIKPIDIKFDLLDTGIYLSMGNEYVLSCSINRIRGFNDAYKYATRICINPNLMNDKTAFDTFVLLQKGKYIDLVNDRYNQAFILDSDGHE